MYLYIPPRGFSKHYFHISGPSPIVWAVSAIAAMNVTSFNICSLMWGYILPALIYWEVIRWNLELKCSYGDMAMILPLHI